MPPKKPTRKTSARKRTTAKKTTARKTTARRKPAARKKTTRRSGTGRRGPESASSERKMIDAERDPVVWEMRKGGATLQMIADALGYADASGPAKSIERTMQRLHEQGEDTAHSWRVLLTARLEAILWGPELDIETVAARLGMNLADDDQREQLEMILAETPPGSEGLMARAVAGHLGSVDRVATIIEKLAKMWGANAPERVEHSGKDGQPIEMEVSPVEWMKGRMDELADRLKAQDRAKKRPKGKG